MTRSNLDNPIFLFILLVLIVTVNAISSIHFLLVMLAGILFTAFYRCLRKRYLYSLAFVIISFLWNRFVFKMFRFEIPILRSKTLKRSGYLEIYQNPANPLNLSLKSFASFGWNWKRFHFRVAMKKFHSNFLYQKFRKVEKFLLVYNFL